MTPQDDRLDGIPVICKRQRAEDVNIKIHEADDIVSDVFTTSVLFNLEDAMVTMEINLFERSVSTREDVFILSADGETVAPVRVENREWVRLYRKLDVLNRWFACANEYLGRNSTIQCRSVDAFFSSVGYAHLIIKAVKKFLFSIVQWTYY